jgi:hypothetical protein
MENYGLCVKVNVRSSVNGFDGDIKIINSKSNVNVNVNDNANIKNIIKLRVY